MRTFIQWFKQGVAGASFLAHRGGTGSAVRADARPHSDCSDMVAIREIPERAFEHAVRWSMER